MIQSPLKAPPPNTATSGFMLQHGLEGVTQIIAFFCLHLFFFLVGRVRDPSLSLDTAWI